MPFWLKVGILVGAFGILWETGWIGWGIVFTLFVGLAVTLVRFVVVPESERWVVERFGKARRRRDGKPRIFKPGLHIILRWIDKVRAQQSLQEQLRETKAQDVLTGNVRSNLQGAFYFKIGRIKTDTTEAFVTNSEGEYVIEEATDEDVYNATYQFFPESPKPAEGLDDFAEATLRDVASRIATPNFDRLEDAKAEINRLVRHDLNIAATSQRWGIVISRHVLPEFMPANQKVIDALESRVIGEKEGQAQEARSVGQKAARINLAEAEKQEITLRAEGRKAEEIAKAEAQAKASDNMKTTISKIGEGIAGFTESLKGLHPIAQFLGLFLATPAGIDLLDAGSERLRPSSSRRKEDSGKDTGTSS